MRARALVLLTAGTLAACGGSPEEDAVRDAVTEYANAMLAGDGRTACARMTEALQQFMLKAYPEKRDCRSAVGAIRAHVRTGGSDVEIGDIEVYGDTATALVSGGDGDRGSRQILRKVGGSWRVDVAPREI